MSLLKKIVRALLLLPPEPPPHDPYDNPKIRKLREKRLQAERTANRVEQAYLPRHRRKDAQHG